MIGVALLFSVSLGQAPAPLFQHLDLARPGLEAVRAAVDRGDGPAAASALRDYYRERQSPQFLKDGPTRPAPSTTYDTAAAERVLRREVTFVGKPGQLSQDIDWTYNPYKDHEWPIELNRHGIWVQLARAWWHTGQAKYAADLADQIDDWLQDCVRPETARQAGFTWRTLECGIRLSGSWPETLFRAVDSDAFTPELVVGMLEGFRQQADWLTKFQGGGNWLVMERTGLLTCGLVFPEFRESQAWVDRAWKDLSDAMADQVLPDGAQVELTPHYHAVTYRSFLTAADVAQRNGLPLPPAYRAGLEAMMDYTLKTLKPSGHIPMLNDSDHDNQRGHLLDSGRRFDRPDMLWVGSEGREGTPPEFASVALKHSGQYVMRTGYGPDDVYLLCDAGPYGYGHQHEDKLGLDVWAHGEEQIVDPGRFTYQGGPWRSYFVSTASHSTMLVDGQGQRRRGTPRGWWIAREPLPNRWVSTPHFDFLSGAYEDGWNAAPDLAHVRKILFAKPSLYLISDRLVPQRSDAREHQATVQFQLARPGAKVLADGLTVVSQGEQSGLVICPAPDPGLAVEFHEGEENPPLGWVAWSLHRAEKIAATMVHYSIKGQPILAVDTVLVPYAGTEPPTVSVRRLGEAAGRAALEVTIDGQVTRLWVDQGAGPATVDGWAVGDEIAIVRAGQAVTVPNELRGDPQAVDAGTIEGAAVPIVATPADLEYGYADGGGLIYSVTVADGDRAPIWHVQEGVSYRYELQQPGRPTTTGIIKLPAPTVFDFADGTRQGFSDSGTVVDGVLSVTGEATTAVAYVHASRKLRVETSDAMAFRCRLRCTMPDGGDGFYAKLTLRDRDGDDWSCYFARDVPRDWREVTADLSSFRGDTRDKPTQQGRPMPEGLVIESITFAVRKGATKDAVAPVFELDEVRLSGG